MIPRTLLTALATAAAASAALGAPPNILFIAVDDLRPSIGAYGDPLAVTPNLDRLATTGTLFERAYCQQAVCSPSRTSLLTGLRPDSTRIYNLSTHFRSTVPDVVTLPQLFKEHGYEVVGRGKIYHGNLDDPASWSSAPSEGRSLKGGSYALPESTDPSENPLEDRRGKRGTAWERADVPDNAYGDGIIAEEGVELLGKLRDGGKPFFLALGFAKPHLPFNAPERYWAMHDREKLWPPPNRSLPPGVPAWISQPGWELRNAYFNISKDASVPIDLETEKTLRHGYYAATSYVDAQIGKVLQALEDLNLANETIVVLWGDHGFHVGDHGTWCKHTNFEVAVRSTLLLRVPGRGTSARVPATVEFIDVYPTLVELAGLPAPKHLEGRSLAPYLDAPDRPADKPAFSQYPRGSIKGNNPMMGYSVTTANWRYTEWLRTDTGAVVFRELYNLANDPHVTRNLADDPAHAETVAQHSALLTQAGSEVERLRTK